MSTSTEHELRYRGHLLGFHPSLEAARAHAAKHHADIVDKEQVTVEPARPVRLFCRGVLADTFLTKEDAHAALKKKTTALAPANAWLVVDLRELGAATLHDVLALHAAANEPAPAVAAPAPAAPHAPPETEPEPPATNPGGREPTA